MQLITKTTLALTLILTTGLASASAADAKAIWQKDCSKCHGPEGKGDTKMGKKLEIRDLTDAKVQDALKDEQMFKAIKEGVKDGDKTKMKPTEGVNDEEIKALVAYVRKLKK
jgi:mono/diheme cytochrome c family protein